MIGRRRPSNDERYPFTFAASVFDLHFLTMMYILITPKIRLHFTVRIIIFFLQISLSTSCDTTLLPSTYDFNTKKDTLILLLL